MSETGRMGIWSKVERLTLEKKGCLSILAGLEVEGTGGGAAGLILLAKKLEGMDR